MKPLKLVLDFVNPPEPNHPDRLYVSDHGYIPLRKENSEERELRESWEAADREAHQ